MIKGNGLGMVDVILESAGFEAAANGKMDAHVWVKPGETGLAATSFSEVNEKPSAIAMHNRGFEYGQRIDPLVCAKIVVALERI